MESDFLNSWKEIACYLGRGVRTVQRWERDMGLPVRRPRGRQRSAVIALRGDLDAWLDRCPTLGAPRAGAEADWVVLRARVISLHDKAMQLTQRTSTLQHELQRAMLLAQRTRGAIVSAAVPKRSASVA